MVLNQCIVKGCHSSNSENKQDISSGGRLHPVPKHVFEDPHQQKKWIELVKVNIHSGAFRVRIGPQKLLITQYGRNTFYSNV